MQHDHWFTAALHDACRSFSRITAAYLFGFWAAIGLGTIWATGRLSDFPAPWVLYLLTLRGISTLPGFIAFFLGPTCWVTALMRREPHDVIAWWLIAQVLWALAGYWQVWAYPHHYWPMTYGTVDDWFAPVLETFQP